MPESFIDIQIEIPPQIDKIIRALEGGSFTRSLHEAFRDFADDVFHHSKEVLTREMRSGTGHNYTGQLVRDYSLLSMSSQSRAAGGGAGGLADEISFTLGWPPGTEPRTYVTPFDRGSAPAAKDQGGSSFERIVNWVIKKNIVPRAKEYKSGMTKGRLAYTGYTRFGFGKGEYVRLHQARIGAKPRYRPATPRVLAFFIWRKIMREGTEPTGVVSNTYTETMNYVDRSGAYVAQQIARRFWRELRT